jgi:aminopeptidase-like protein/aminoglycoside N3'-acetyltransferase
MSVMIQSSYSSAEITSGLQESGLLRGDLVYVHAADAAFAAMDSCLAEIRPFELLVNAIRDVIGTEGTLFVPAFSLSFAHNQVFDPDHVPAIAGEWNTSVGFSEYIRCRPGVVRSADPNFSVCGLGPQAGEILGDLSATTYGPGCFYERLMLAAGKICCIGGVQHASFLHYAEETLGVPFRYRKLFTGSVRRDGATHKQGWISSVPIESGKGTTDGTRVAAIARQEGRLRIAVGGACEIATIACDSLYELLRREIAKNPWITARGPASDPIVLQDRRADATQLGLHLPENASMTELIAAIWRLPRDIVSDGYDVALQGLSTQAPMVIHEYPSGTECWTWLVPEKWTCHKASLDTMDGRCLFSYQDNPLHVVSYSLPIDRVVSREELFRHLHVHPELPDAIPFIFKYYERDWGLCCSQKLKASLNEEHYRVVIDSSSGYGTLKVGEIVARGSSTETFVFCAHLCHPAMVNDDLSGVVVGLKVMQELLKRSDLRYTYRLLILPETIGSVAYLSHNEQLIPKMMGGLFLEMLGLNQSHALQLSFAGDTEIDRCLTRVLQDHDPRGWTGAFRTVVGNDERQFNAPGVRVPMLSLSRVQKSQPGKHPYYPEYHSSHDTPELASPDRLADSRDLVLKMVDAIEGNAIPVNRFKGEIFCSRYGLNVDAYTDREGNKALFDVLFLIDGTRSEAEIARICNLSVDSVRQLVEELRRLDLVEFSGAGRN